MRRKQQLKSMYNMPWYYFCDKLDEIILLIALEAVKFNSSMEPNNVSEFTWRTCFNTKNWRIYKMFFLSGKNLSCSCKWLLMILSFLSMNATITNPFGTLMQVKLVRFINATFSASSRSKRTNFHTNFISSKYGHSFFTVKNVNKLNVHFEENW